MIVTFYNKQEKDPVSGELFGTGDVTPMAKVLCSQIGFTYGVLRLRDNHGREAEVPMISDGLGSTCLEIGDLVAGDFIVTSGQDAFFEADNETSFKVVEFASHFNLKTK